MKERYTLPLTKIEARQLLKEMAMAENTQEKQTKKFWERHEKIITKLYKVIYNSKDDKESS
ncbi:hypothetical protein M0R04_12630 [Candidatus Dojkabacteria bacterium]|jgi:hypothetical protein|nr:hypothetical protein [Candidatus Dojkabacteria bacterium]